MQVPGVAAAAVRNYGPSPSPFFDRKDARDPFQGSIFMPITPEMLAERSAAAAEFAAADEAKKAADARAAAAQTRLDNVHAQMGAAMNPGEIFTLVPHIVPAIKKDEHGVVSVGFIDSAHPNATPLAAQ